jgi:hypothetical protein
MKKYCNIIIILILPLIVFPHSIRGVFLVSKNEHINDTTVEKYYQIIHGLNNNHVFWFRMSQNIERNDSSKFPLYHETDFIEDSIIFWKCYEEFFSQDLDIIRWLLTFKNDKSYEHPIWQPKIDPTSSYFPSCLFHPTNSQMAITLIEIYLNGYGFQAWEYHSDNYKMGLRKRFNYVAKFLKNNKGKSIIELRELWKKTNAR